MCSPEARLSLLLTTLEEAICKAHNVQPAPALMRDASIQKVKLNLGKAQYPQAVIHQAVVTLSQSAPIQQKLTAKLDQVKNNGNPVTNGYIALLAQVVQEPMVRGILATSVSSDKRDAHYPARAGSQQQPDLVASISHVQPPTTQHLSKATTSAFATPIASMPAVSTPGPQVPPEKAFNIQGQAARSRSNHPVDVTGGRGPQQPTPKQTPAYQTNPFYNQDDLQSPPLRAKDYTPSLMQDMSTRKQELPNLSSPTFPDVGALFQPSASTVMARQGCTDHSRDSPQWTTSRPALAGLDVIQAAQREATHSSVADSLSTLPLPAQEAAVMRDLLTAFSGLSGKYIRPHLVQPTATDGLPSASGSSVEQGPALTFTVAAAMDSCIEQQVKKLLPLCDAVVLLQRFVETRSAYKYGLVAQACAACVRGMLDDWKLVVGQLETQLLTGRLTLQAMVFHCQGPMQGMLLLGRIAAEAAARNLTASGLLNLLHQKSSSLVGDRAAVALVQKLLSAAATPYFKLLEQWLCEGLLNDPYQEFMVQEDKSVLLESDEDDNNAWWRLRYTLRCDPSEPQQLPDVPLFLQAHSQIILTTGKYLTCIRECGQPVLRPLPASDHLHYDAAGSYVALIQSAHRAASSCLLQFMMQEHQLLTWLRSLKHFFLMDQGDLMVHLMEAAKEELNKPCNSIGCTRLQSLLELAVRTSSVSSDPYADSLAHVTDPRNLVELAKHALPPTNRQHSIALTSTSSLLTPGVERSAASERARRRTEDLVGWEVLLLGWRCQWPLSLMLSGRQLRQYQLLFKMIFMLRHLEARLAGSWRNLQYTRRLPSLQRGRLARGYLMFQQLLFLVREVLRYVTQDVVEPAWGHMELEIRHATNIDQVMDSHTAFLSRCLEGCLLTRSRVLKGLMAVQALAQQLVGSCRGLARALGHEVADDQGPDGAWNPLMERVAMTPDEALEQFEKDVLGLHNDFEGRVQEMVQAMKDTYNELLNGRTLGRQVLESKEELESLHDLITRLHLRSQDDDSVVGLSTI